MTIHPELTKQQTQHQAIRAKLMNAPIKLTREIFEQSAAEIKRLTRVVANQESDLKAKKEVVAKLLADLSEERRTIQFLNKQISALSDVGSIPASSKYRTVKAIVSEILDEWPGVSWKQILGSRRSWHIVRSRHLCMQAVYEQRPDLSLPQIARIFHKDHSTVCYAVYKRSPRRTSPEYLERMEMVKP